MDPTIRIVQDVRIAIRARVVVSPGGYPHTIHGNAEIIDLRAKASGMRDGALRGLLEGPMIVSTETTDLRVLASAEMTDHRVLASTETTGHRVLASTETTGHRVLASTETTDHRVLASTETTDHRVQASTETTDHRVRDTTETTDHRVRDTTETTDHRVRDTTETTGAALKVDLALVVVAMATEISDQESRVRVVNTER